MKARRLLWLYCVLACLALAGWLVSIVASSGDLRHASAEAAQQVQTASTQADEQRELVTTMEEEQRTQRATLSPQDAIRYSAEIQTQQEIYRNLLTALDEAKAAHLIASESYQRHMNTLIPIIGLLILHIVGTMLFWPRPEHSPAK